MMRGENTDSLPTDLIMDIFSRLTAKSVARLRCLSKLWCSIFRLPYFTDLFFTRSSARAPRLLIAFHEEGDNWCFFTSPQHQNPYDKSSSSVVTADCHMKFRRDSTWGFLNGHVSGLISFRRNSFNSEEQQYVICNPSTGQFGSLPLLSAERQALLGFDPIDKEFKVLSISYRSFDESQILTLGTGKASWRKIHCPLNHYAHSDPQVLATSICINGVLYYLAQQTNVFIVCFDVRSEKFKFIHKDFFSKCKWNRTKVINYKGKLGVVTFDNDRYSMWLYLWIMKDVDNPESKWSKYVCDFKTREGNEIRGWEYHFFSGDVCIVGVTATGDIVLSMNYTETSVPFYVFYINPKRNIVKIVEIQGLGPIRNFPNVHMVRVFIDYVEDLKFKDLKFINMMTTCALTTRSPSVPVPEQKRNPTSISTSSKARLQFESTNKFDSLGLLEDDEFI